MGVCHTSAIPIEPELSLPKPNQLSIQYVKPSKYQINEDGATPVNQLPELPKTVRLKMNELGPLDFDQCGKFQRGKQLGPYKFPNGTVYAGEWYSGKPHGKGKYYLPDSSYFQGVSFQGEIEGFGRLIHANGDYFEGELKNGQANGKGKYIEKDTIYEGYFKDNLQNGVGFERNSKYEFKGQFSEGQKLRGKLTLKDKKYLYDGEFKFNKFHGKGSLIIDNEKYEGQFVKGLKNGKGKMIYEDGSYFEGEFKGDEKHGVGKLYGKNKKLIAEERWENGVLVK